MLLCDPLFFPYRHPSLRLFGNRTNLTQSQFLPTGMRVSSSAAKDACFIPSRLSENVKVPGISRSRCFTHAHPKGRANHVTAIEKRSGLSKHITIARALESKSEAEIAEARKRLEALYSPGQSEQEDAELEDAEGPDQMGNEDSLRVQPAAGENFAANDDWSSVAGEGKQLIERSRQLLEQLHEEDREEAIDLNAQIESAIATNDATALKQAASDLRELLFFVEGRA